MVARWVAKIPGDPEENLAQGYLILVQAFHDYYKEQRESTLEQYCGTRVKNELLDFSRENKLIRVPASSGRRGKKTPKVAFVGNEEELLGQREVTQKPDVPDITDSLDLEILRLKIEGFPDREIAERLGYSTSFIRQRRITVMERVKK